MRLWLKITPSGWPRFLPMVLGSTRMTIVVSSFLLVSSMDGSAQDSIVRSPQGADTVAADAATKRVPVGALGVGDTLKIAFYESLQSDDDAWVASSNGKNAVPKNFYQRPELTGSYVVNAEGYIALPMLGRFPVLNQLPRSVEAVLAHSYESLVGRKGFVSILSIESLPISITGVVDKPGSFPFVPGMTVLHAVAAAGGVKTKVMEPWQKVEVRREIERLRTGIEELKQLAARTEVLRSESRNVQVASIGIDGIATEGEMSSYLEEESRQRRLSGSSRSSQRAALTEAVQNAEADLALRRARLGVYDESIRQRQERLAGIESLSKRGLTASSELLRSQSELADTEDRKQQTLIDVESALQRLTSARKEFDRFQTESGIEVEKATADAERGLLAAVQSTESSLGLFQSMITTDERDEAALTIEIIRLNELGSVVVLPAAEETMLRPGDVVRVR